MTEAEIPFKYRIPEYIAIDLATMIEEVQLPNYDPEIIGLRWVLAWRRLLARDARVSVEPTQTQVARLLVGACEIARAEIAVQLSIADPGELRLRRPPFFDGLPPVVQAEIEPYYEPV